MKINVWVTKRAGLVFMSKTLVLNSDCFEGLLSRLLIWKYFKGVSIWDGTKLKCCATITENRQKVHSRDITTL